MEKLKSMAVNGATPELLPVLSKAGDHPCHRCSKCCQYVAIEIDEPETMKDYEHIVWYLYHRDVSVFVDWERAWYIRFTSSCENLSEQGLCGVYDHRPSICKEFDWRECENHLTPEDGPADKWYFETAADFLVWFEKRRPKTYRRYRRFKRKLQRVKEEPELERLEATDSAPGPVA